MKVRRDKQNGIFLEYSLTSEEVLKMRRETLVTTIEDASGNSLGITAGIKVGTLEFFSEFDPATSQKIPIEEQSLTLAIKPCRYQDLVRGRDSEMNWGYGDIILRVVD